VQNDLINRKEKYGKEKNKEETGSYKDQKEKGDKKEIVRQQ
jgi:hypothetical protein